MLPGMRSEKTFENHRDNLAFSKEKQYIAEDIDFFIYLREANPKAVQKGREESEKKERFNRSRQCGIGMTSREKGAFL